MLLIDDLPPRPEPLAPPPSASLGSEGGLPSGGPPSGPNSQPVSAERFAIHHALIHVVTADDLRWHRAEGIDACAGVTAPHNWCIMLPLSQRVQPGVYTLMALSRYRDALVRHAPPAEPWVYPPLVPEILTSCFDVLILPPRPFRTEKPLTQDAFHLVSLFLQKRCAYPALCENHDGSGALLLTPRLDAQTSFAKLFADLATKEDVRRADLATLLLAHPHQRRSLPGTSRRWNLSLGALCHLRCASPFRMPRAMPSVSRCGAGGSRMTKGRSLSLMGALSIPRSRRVRMLHQYSHLPPHRLASSREDRPLLHC